jgi:glycosyltransferase involved in cell wall biosynthesis
MEKLSILIPVYNEAASLERFVSRLLRSPCPLPREFIFIDDGSSDGSDQILHQLETEEEFQVIRQEANQGKGASIRAGIRQAGGGWIMIQDADFEYDPAEVPRLLEPLLTDQADVVFGSRFKKNVLQVHRTYHYSVNRFLTFLSNLLSGIYLTDMETCYKIFPADLLRSMNLTSKRFGIEIELTAYLAKTSARIYELPISYRPRTRLQGKKISWKDGLAALAHLIRYNFRAWDACFTDLPDRYRP